MRMATLQRQLLDAAVQMLEPGGILVYASCSLQPEEGALLIAQALATGLPMVPCPATWLSAAGSMAFSSAACDGITDRLPGPRSLKGTRR